ncbi:MAG: sulfotransferase [Mycobacteriales bacterium]
MSTQAFESDVRRVTWTPPERPEWVRRVNAEGTHLDLRAVVPLDENSLLAAAKANTGLEDFGADDWAEPFQVLARSLDEESELNLMGRLMVRADMLMFLEGRLQIEDTYKRHPEIDDQQIEKPLLIIGQGRTGTSILQNMLAADPDNQTTTEWEAMFPCPPPEKETYFTDPRIERAEKITSMRSRVTPEIASMHEFGARLGTETIHLDCLAFRSLAWFTSMLGQAPSYAAYMTTQDDRLAIQYEKRILKLLQWKNPRRTWILKSPYALTQLPSMLSVYPDMGLVWTHRDPVKAMASVVNLIGTLQWIHSDKPFLGDSLAALTNADLGGMMMSQPIDWLESGVIPKDSLCNIQYDDFVVDPVSVAQQIYDHFAIEMTSEGRTAMQRFMDGHPREARPTHKYDAGPADLIEHERRAFQRYQEYFNVPSEV